MRAWFERFEGWRADQVRNWLLAAIMACCATPAAAKDTADALAKVEGSKVESTRIESGTAEMVPPRTASASIDWSAAIESLQPLQARLPAIALARMDDGVGANGSPPLAPRVLHALNAALSARFTEIERSPVPVLLPVNAEALLRRNATVPDGETGDGDDDDDDIDRHLGGFAARIFFIAGPSGYSAALGVRPEHIPELAGIKFPEPIDVHISGSSVIYEPEGTELVGGLLARDMQEQFPGIRRMIHEHHLRYTFVRYGVPYVVSVRCFDARRPRYRMPTCRDADRIAMHFLKELRVAGGLPQPALPMLREPIERPQSRSPNFTFLPPGEILPGTGFRGASGQADRTVYAAIRFPLEKPPAYVNSQLFQNRKRSRSSKERPNYDYPWQDNFCERRGFPVGQCPAGIGHQGQDIRGPLCEPAGDAERCPQPTLVAVRDSVILRAPGQEALYLVVNSAGEHIRFRYLHMHPDQLDRAGMINGRRLKQGEPIGPMSNFSRREGGTSYHLHFDIQVPTRDGWVFVNPYMTLVAAYERLIDERGMIETAVEAEAAPKPPAAGIKAKRTRVLKNKRPKRPRGKRAQTRSSTNERTVKPLVYEHR